MGRPFSCAFRQMRSYVERCRLYARQRIGLRLYSIDNAQTTVPRQHDPVGDGCSRYIRPRQSRVVFRPDDDCTAGCSIQIKSSDPDCCHESRRIDRKHRTWLCKFGIIDSRITALSLSHWFAHQADYGCVAAQATDRKEAITDRSSCEISAISEQTCSMYHQRTGTTHCGHS